mmetsp:Transcript_3866/g.7960  ORF Transcript_3866/g.7960 Transcript_3866/m.7960 type:complete len:246 (-) Transcript_3866:839-1576(-)
MEKLGVCYSGDSKSVDALCQLEGTEGVSKLNGTSLECAEDSFVRRPRVCEREAHCRNVVRGELSDPREQSSPDVSKQIGISDSCMGVCPSHCGEVSHLKFSYGGPYKGGDCVLEDFLIRLLESRHAPGQLHHVLRAALGGSPYERLPGELEELPVSEREPCERPGDGSQFSHVQFIAQRGRLSSKQREQLRIPHLQFGECPDDAGQVEGLTELQDPRLHCPHGLVPQGLGLLAGEGHPREGVEDC